MLQKKEIKRLKWEYAKRSEELNKFHYFLKKNNFKSLAEFIEKGLNTPLPAEYNPQIISTFVDFQDSLKYPSFKEWCEKGKGPVELRIYPITNMDFKEWLLQDIDHWVKSSRERKGSRSSLECYKEWLNKYFSCQTESLFLHLSLIDCTTEEVEGILQQVKSRLNKMVIKKRFMADELNRYLKVFDLRNSGLKWKDIFFKVTGREDFTENARRALRKDFDKANAVIKNIEEGKYYWWT